MVFSLQITLLCLCIALCSSLTANTTLEVANPQGVLVVQAFGMARGGTLSFNYSVTQKDSSAELSKNQTLEHNIQYEMLVVTEAQRTAYFGGLNFEVNGTSTTACMSPVAFRRQLYGRGTFSHTIGQNEPDAEQYSVILLQCRETKSKYIAKATVNASLVNPLPYVASETTHLGIDVVPRLAVDSLLIFAYSVILLMLLIQMYHHRTHLSYLHHTFAVVLVSQIVDLVVDYYYFKSASDVGSTTTLFDITSDMMDFVAESCLLSALLLLAMGWSTIHFRITRKQMLRVTGTVGGFFTLGLCSSSCQDASSTFCQSIYLLTHVMRALVLLAVIICLNFTITQLRTILAHSPWDPSTPYYYARTRQFHTVRLAFVAYLLLPTCFLLIQDLMLTWKEYWLNFFLMQLRNVMMFLVTGTSFSPFQDAFLTRAFDGTFNNGVENRPHEE